MICPHCGVQALAGNRFCHRCRGRLIAGAPSPPARPALTRPLTAAPRPPRPRALLLLALVELFAAALCLLLAAAFAASFYEGKDAARDIAFCGAAALAGLALLMAGIGLLRMRPVSRPLHVALGILSLPLVPLGTAIGGLLLAWFARKGAGALLSDDPARRCSPEALEAAGSARLVGWAAGLAALAPVGFTAAMAVFVAEGDTSASKKSPRVEAAAVAELRAAAAAERAWADLDEGRYAHPSCLAAPASCRHDLPESTPPFLAADAAGAGPRHGYRFSFHAPAAAQDRRTGLASYALVAEAEPRGSARWLCVDPAGRVCAGSGARPESLDGRCPATCAALP